jgi:hypothetical protein
MAIETTALRHTAAFEPLADKKTLRRCDRELGATASGTR